MPNRCTDVLKLMDFYIGTYTRGTNSEGIYHLELNEDSHHLCRAAVADNPSWLVQADDRLVYAVAEVNNGNGRGGRLRGRRSHPGDRPADHSARHGAAVELSI